MSRQRNRQTLASIHLRSPEDIERIVVMERMHLYNHSLPCGAAALRRHLHEHGGVTPLPSVHQVAQVLTRHGLTHGRTGWYEGELPASANIFSNERR